MNHLGGFSLAPRSDSTSREGARALLLPRGPVFSQPCGFPCGLLRVSLTLGVLSEMARVPVRTILARAVGGGDALNMMELYFVDLRFQKLKEEEVREKRAAEGVPLPRLVFASGAFILPVLTGPARARVGEDGQTAGPSGVEGSWIQSTNSILVKPRSLHHLSLPRAQLPSFVGSRGSPWNFGVGGELSGYNSSGFLSPLLDSSNTKRGASPWSLLNLF